MAKSVSVLGVEEYAKVMDDVEIDSVVEFRATTFIFGKHNLYGQIIGASNPEECYLIINV